MSVSPGSFEAKNAIRVVGAVAHVQLTGGDWMLIDSADIPLIAKYRWSVTRGNGGKKYARAYAGGGRANPRAIRAHRLILGETPGREPDHINGDGLDNRRANLRALSRAENIMNAGAYSHGKSGHRGVCWYPAYRKWRAYIHIAKKARTLGYFENIEDAVAARKDAEEQRYPGINRQAGQI